MFDVLFGTMIVFGVSVALMSVGVVALSKKMRSASRWRLVERKTL